MTASNHSYPDSCGQQPQTQSVKTRKAGCVIALFFHLFISEKNKGLRSIWYVVQWSPRLGSSINFYKKTTTKRNKRQKYFASLFGK